MILQSFSLQKPPLISPSFLLKRRIIISALLFDGDFNLKRRGQNSQLRAVEKESQFELDPEKAREALQKLDQQLQTLSEKPITPPKKRVSSSNMGTLSHTSDPGHSRDMRGEMPDFSGSYFAYSAFALVILSIFYNILFITVIKPSVDGPEPELAPASIALREAPYAVVRQSPPQLPEVTIQR
ncbi:hypothetical protein HHK36_011913 [Tetracentron sinense]|uniref:Uncharacterized protein n=1 Tax=Tetracentron sinense TaxID=13715 RepID=A0A834ZJH4_TETSI|nr:hypothetical protein HHK36_011913 [Tetracentron sinense]